MKYICCEPRRLEVIKLSGGANGIEFLEVLDHLEPDLALRQRTLFVRLLQAVPTKPGGECQLGAENVSVDGGTRLPSVPVAWVAAADKLPAGVDSALVEGIETPASMLVVRTTMSGDFSQYTLRLRASANDEQSPDGFDPRLSAINFSFKVECASDFDCAAVPVCPPTPVSSPNIDYLAKDYSGFRRLMLDRLSLLAPGWRERSAADVGVALVELLAYAADNLSYRQDAIANEAYLATAHRRVSVRRHARLVDYELHDGCNARAWVHVEVSADHTLPSGTLFLTRSGSLPTGLLPESVELREALASGAAVFESAGSSALFSDLNRMSIYTWGDLGCCLPRGAKRATLRGAHPDLKKGDVLVFQEIVSPTTFVKEDADHGKRWAVRLVDVKPGVDPSGGLFDSPPVKAAVPLTEVFWDASDALPFPLCISVTERPGLELSNVLGNIVLVDHGQTIRDEALGKVPEPRLRRVGAQTGGEGCRRREDEMVQARYRPALGRVPLTRGFDLAGELAVSRVQGSEEAWWSATALVGRDPHHALPQIEGHFAGSTRKWTPSNDLLGSDGEATAFVVETEDDNRALLRFGDGVHGKRPSAGGTFTVTYRVGNGTSGNVGAKAIAHVVSKAAGIFGEVANPLSAAGGIDPEDLEAARRDAPEAFRTQERAVTAADYAAAAERRAEIQRAAATFRWTGSWHTVFVTADRLGGAAVDTDFEARLRRHLERFRTAGYDLEVDSPRYVPLDVTLHICVQPGYFRSEVLRAVNAELGAGVLPDGRRALFHPDNFSFGDPVYLSRVVAAAQAVAGVEAVWPQKFRRLAAPDAASLENGVIPIGQLEIAQLANDPNFRERGRLTLEAGGGQ
jgi:baseplate J-like protein